MSYYIATTLDASFEAAQEKVTEGLKTQGFGVISEIDIQEKLKDKLGVEFRRYKILGACNPSFAYEALQLEDKIGTMLPCNIILQEVSENKTEIAAINPKASMQAVENPKLADIAEEVNTRLGNFINEL